MQSLELKKRLVFCFILNDPPATRCQLLSVQFLWSQFYVDETPHWPLFGHMATNAIWNKAFLQFNSFACSALKKASSWTEYPNLWFEAWSFHFFNPQRKAKDTWKTGQAAMRDAIESEMELNKKYIQLANAANDIASQDPHVSAALREMKRGWYDIPVRSRCHQKSIS